MRGSNSAAMQNPENRSTDPTPLKDPSGYVQEKPKAGAMANWQRIGTHAVLSGGLYTGVNYAIHKVMKTKGGKKDPAAIKSLSAGKIIKQGGGQAVASIASGMTYQTIGGYIPDMVTKYAPTKPLVTATYKTVGGMALQGVPSLWNGVTDFIISAGSDYGADYLYPSY